MQYKIPVQIENEDPIFLWLSLRQLTIVMIGGGIWYSIFKSFAPLVWAEIAAIPAVLVFWLAIAIAKFKISEMSFIVFVLSYVRLKINMEERKWTKTIDTFSPIEIWYVNNIEEKKENTIDFKSKIDKMNNLDKQINNI